jgi:spore coat polysaccharide biosynthesis protein SpsF
MTRNPTRPRVVGIIQARVNSRRLPRKVLTLLAGRTLLHHVVERAFAANTLDAVLIATSDSPADDAIAEQAETWGVPYYRGPEEDVLARFVGACAMTQAQIGVRITADNPLIDIPGIDAVVARHLQTDADYTHNLGDTGLYRYRKGNALGLGVEAFRAEALNTIQALDLKPLHRSDVTRLLEENPERFRCEVVPARPILRRPDLRLTLDNVEDLAVFRFLYARLYKADTPIDAAEAIRLLDTRPDIAALNRVHAFPRLPEVYKIQPDGTLRLVRVETREAKDAVPEPLAIAV